jgi:hypothetical protein
MLPAPRSELKKMPIYTRSFGMERVMKRGQLEGWSSPLSYTASVIVIRMGLGRLNRLSPYLQRVTRHFEGQAELEPRLGVYSAAQ